MNTLAPYLVYFIAPLLLGLAVQWWLRSTVARYGAKRSAVTLTGAEVARRILDANGLSAVEIRSAEGGALSDHYDPHARTVNLSAAVHDERSLTAAAIAAHEVGHAIQHALGYLPMRARAAIFPAVSVASNLWQLLLFAGFILHAAGLVTVAIALYALAVAFHIVTLPVEFDASRRALQQLDGLAILAGSEQAGARRVLTAAAMTYVAGALAAVAQLAYFLMLSRN